MRLSTGLRILVFLVLSVIFGGIACFAAIFGGKKKRLFHYVRKWWAWTSCKVCGISLKVIDSRNILKIKERYVIIANHTSMLDALVLAAVLPRAKWVVKEEIFRIPFIGWAVWLAGDIGTTRRAIKGEADERFRNIGRDLKEQNCSIVFFPEGTRSRDGTVKPFKRGAFITAPKAKLDILPIVISGTENLMRGEDIRTFRPGKVRIFVGNPIASFGNMPNDLKDLCFERIVRLKETLDESTDNVIVLFKTR